MPLLFLAATGMNSQYRKPAPLMLKFYEKKYGAVTIKDSLYCGDAAGRPSDHSADDLKFAANTGLPFLTPEEMFLGETPTKTE